MTRKVIALTFLFLMLAVCASNGTEDFNVAGKWLINGTGHVDKSFVRSRLELSGYINFQTSEGEEIQMIESYDAYIRIDATTLNIKVYDEYITNGIQLSVPVPARIPTEEYPIELPTLTYDGLTYDVKITGTNSGTVLITGVVKDVGIIGDVEIETESKIWREGTSEPETDSGKSSGCKTGAGMTVLMLMGVIKLVRNRHRD